MTRDTAWLEDTLDALDRIVFLGALSSLGVRAKWMRHRVRKTHFLYGTFDLQKKRIEINPVLQNDWVPEHVVIAVLHHEALHAIHGPEHSYTFKLDEQRFLHHADSESWCADHYDRLIVAAPPAKEPPC